MKITRRQLRRLISEEIKHLTETQLSSNSPWLPNKEPQAIRPEDPYVEGNVGPDDVSDTIAGLERGITSSEQAKSVFAKVLRSQGKSPEDYSVNCTPGVGGSWRCGGDRRDRTSSGDPYDDYYADNNQGSVGESVNLFRELIREVLGGEKSKIFLLIGPPSVGKSEWLNREGPKHGIVNPYTISMDEVTDQVGDKYGFDYDEMFEKPIQPGQPGYTEDQHSEEYGEMINQPLAWKTWEPKVWSKVAEAQAEAMGVHEQIVDAAASSGRPVVVDMTNMNKGGRERMIKQIDAPNHELVAIVFDWNDDVEFLKKSAASRAKERFEKTGRRKTIPPQAFDRMVGGYQPPTEDEGWDNIIHVPAWWAEKK